MARIKIRWKVLSRFQPNNLCGGIFEMFDKDAQFHKCTDGHVKPYPSLLCSRCMANGVNFNAFDGYKKLQAELDKHRWIPVSERLPKSPTQYLCCYSPYYGELPQMFFATTWSKLKGFYLEDGTRVFPTHWKPIILPE